MRSFLFTQKTSFPTFSSLGYCGRLAQQTLDNWSNAAVRCALTHNDGHLARGQLHLFVPAMVASGQPVGLPHTQCKLRKWGGSTLNYVNYSFLLLIGHLLHFLCLCGVLFIFVGWIWSNVLHNWKFLFTNFVNCHCFFIRISSEIHALKTLKFIRAFLISTRSNFAHLFIKQHNCREEDETASRKVSLDC